MIPAYFVFLFAPLMSMAAVSSYLFVDFIATEPKVRNQVPSCYDSSWDTEKLRN